MSEALDRQKEDNTKLRERNQKALKAKPAKVGIASVEKKTVEIRGPKKTKTKNFELTTYDNGVVKSRIVAIKDKR
jgi:hypothetical protein